MFEPFIMIVHRNRQTFFRVFLTDYVLVQLGDDFPRLELVDKSRPGLRLTAFAFIG